MNRRASREQKVIEKRSMFKDLPNDELYSKFYNKRYDFPHMICYAALVRVNAFQLLRMVSK